MEQVRLKLNYLPFLHNQQLQSLSLCSPKEVGFFYQHVSPQQLKSISELEKHSLPPAETTCGRKQDGHCKEHSLILHKCI